MKWLSNLRREPSGEPVSSAIEGLSSGVPESLPDACGNPPAAAANEDAVESAASSPLGEPESQDAEPTIRHEAATTIEPASVAELVQQLTAMQESIAAGNERVLEQQGRLNELFATRLRSDEAQGRAVEKLHDEMRQYKAGFIRQQLLPLLKEVIFCHDFLTSQIERLSDLGATAGLRGAAASAANTTTTSSGGGPETGGPFSEGNGRKVLDPGVAEAKGEAIRSLEASQQMLLDLLFKYDVEPFRVEGDQFDPKLQQCMQAVPAERSDIDKTVARRGLEGFRSPEGIVRREQVTVYKYTPGAN